MLFVSARPGNGKFRPPPVLNGGWYIDSPLKHPDATTEHDIVQMAVSQGLITTEELRQAQQLHDRQLRRGEFRPVSDILIELKSLTPRQFTRLSDQLVHTSRIGPIPGYQLIGEIGKGAMGVVHKALQQSVDRVVAVKILSRHLSRGGESKLKPVPPSGHPITFHPNRFEAFGTWTTGVTSTAWELPCIT